MFRLISLLIFKINGWKIEDSLVYPEKCVIITAPHTSNWDFLIGQCYRYIQRIYPKYLIKSELFYPILGTILRLNGGIPVYRDKAYNVVSQIVERFHKSNKFLLNKEKLDQAHLMNLQECYTMLFQE